MDRSISCPSCNRDLFPEDAFCSQCGTRLREPQPADVHARRTLVRNTVPTIDRVACGSCNGPLLPGEVFCSTCGARYGGPPVTAGTRASSRAESLRKLETATHGRFEFVRELGRGGMGTVFLAREIDLDRLVAVKVLSSSLLADDAMVERFRREARTIASLRHASIVHVHGVGRAEDLHFFTMDYIDGVSLASVLRTHGPLSIPAVQAILYQVGSALSYAHRPGRGVIHRDVKPGNIMLDTEGNAFVTDFGIARMSEMESGLTITGLIMGTPEYMSPEQCRGDAVSAASDQYALGAVVYAMLTGTPPFTGPHYRVLMAHTSDPAPPVRDLRSDCPAQLADAVARMLAKLPAERWPDIRDALRATGVRPLSADDPAREEIAALVHETARVHAQRDPATPSRGRTPPPTPTWLRILAEPPDLEPGDTAELLATLGFDDGRTQEGTDVEWETTAPAIVRIDAITGQLFAVAPGTAVITARTGGLTQTLPIEIRAARVARLVVETEILELEAGATRLLSAEPRSRRDARLDDRPILWSSSDPGVATVSESGEVLAHRPGRVSLLAHCQGVGAAITVQVKPASVASLRIRDVPPELTVGLTGQLFADPRDARDQRIDRDVSWRSGAPAVVRISPRGRFEALAPGAARLTATCESAEAAVDVRVRGLPAVAVVYVDPAPRRMTVGQQTRVRAHGIDAAGDTVDAAVVFSSSDERLLRVTPEGHLVARAPGRVELIARCDETVARTALEVTPPPVARVEVSEPPAELMAGDTFHLVATCRDVSGDPVERPVTWRTSAPDVVASLGGGRFRAGSAGEARVSAESEGVAAEVPLTVHPVRVVSVRFESPPGILQVGERRALWVSAKDGRGRVVREEAEWSVSDPTVGRVLRDGVLEILAPGELVVTATCGGVSDRIEVHVPAPLPATIVGPVVPDSPVGATATETDHHRTEAKEGTEGTGGRRTALLWGVPSALLAGIVAVVVMWNGGDGDVTPPGPPVAAEVMVLGADGSPAPGALQLVVGDSLALTARVTDSTGTALSPAVTWSSEDTALATVSAAGLVVARAPGSTRVVAVAAGVTQTVEVTVAQRVAVTPPPAPPPPPAAAGIPAERTATPPPAPPPPAPPPAAPVEDGRLQLLVLPWAHVFIDGEQRASETQRLELALPPGSYRLRLANPNTMAVDTTFEIRSGMPTLLRIQMPPRDE